MTLVGAISQFKKRNEALGYLKLTTTP